MNHFFSFTVTILVSSGLVYTEFASANSGCSNESVALELAKASFVLCRDTTSQDDMDAGACSAEKQGLENAIEQAQICANSLAGNKEPPAAASNEACPADFNHLSVGMPRFNDPVLSEIRQSILNTSMSQIVSGAKQQGMSKAQTISMAMRQADEFENTARQNAGAAAEVSTYLTPRAIVTGVNRGSLSLSLPCSGSPSMVEAAECAVIQQVWGAMANREIAKQIEACW